MLDIQNRRVIITPVLASFPTSPQSAAFLARATGITSQTDKTNYDTMITGLVNDGVWSKLDALYIFAAPDQTTALLNLVQNNFNGTTHGTVSFSAAHGFTGDGSTFYIDTGFNQGTATSPQFTPNSASLGVYDLTNDTTTASIPIGNSHQSAAQLILQPSNHMQSLINGGSPAFIPTATSQGFWIATRSSSSTVSAALNGGTFVNAASTAGGVDVDVTMFMFAQNANTTPVSFTPDQLSAAFIGGGLTQTDSNNLSARINAFMTAYGINVY